MKVDKFKKYRGFIITVVQTIVILFIAAMITVFQCSFDLKEFNWINFVFNFGFTTIMKAVYTTYSKNKELEEEDVVLLIETINNDRKEIYNAEKTKDFDAEIERRNKISKLDAYISYLDGLKPHKNKEKQEQRLKDRKWAFNYREALKQELDITKFEEERTLKSIKIDYEHIESSKLFTYGRSAKDRKKKYSFNALGSSLNRALIPTTASLVMSIIFGLLDPDGGFKDGALWVTLAGYLSSIGMGIWWGITNGKTIIREDYLEVLNNVAALVRDIKVKIMKKRDNN